jgi:hypothetical protein
MANFHSSAAVCRQAVTGRPRVSSAAVSRARVRILGAPTEIGADSNPLLRCPAEVMMAAGRQ